MSTKVNAQQMVAKPQTNTHLGSATAKTRAEVTFLIKGTVKSLEDGLALAGANVMLVGLNHAAITDSNGTFKLHVKGCHNRR